MQYQATTTAVLPARPLRIDTNDDARAPLRLGRGTMQGSPIRDGPERQARMGLASPPP